MKKYKINFINQNSFIFVDEGTTVSKACDIAGFPLDLVCNGRGTCGKCSVLIGKSNEKFSVLACQTKIESHMNIYINESDYEQKANILDTNIGDFKFNPSIKKKYLSIKDIKDSKDDEYLHGCKIDVLKKFSNMIYDYECKGITFIYYDDCIIDVQLNDTSHFLYGAALDIGTTSVVAYIYDLNNGKLLKTYSSLNMQISLGADVISRISYSGNNESLDDMNGKIMQTINNMVDKADIELPNFKNNMYNIILCGNSTMQHLLFKLRPDSLGFSPFKSITKDYIECWGHETSIKCASKCKIVFLPLLGGFVGSDTTSVLLCVENDNKIKLVIDLGTNGEIAAGVKNSYYVASTACGPAFEGGTIQWGMRGTTGAIEKFKIENDNIVLKTIDNVEPAGICGSGIIDIVAELLKENIIDNTGSMISKEQYLLKKPQSILCENFANINGINSFIIYKNNDKTIYISQKDIRQIQLAKSSIYSGCIALLGAYGTSIDDVEEVVIAGAFGNYIDVNNAIKIGLLPYSPNAKIISAGNGAGKGVSLFLLNKEIRNKCDEIAKYAIHHELAQDEKFVQEYIKNMNFL